MRNVKTSISLLIDTQIKILRLLREILQCFEIRLQRDVIIHYRHLFILV